jgi:hypothetical protein
MNSEKVRESRLPGNAEVLVTGIYLAGRENNIEHIVESFGSSSGAWHVTQRWTALGEGAVSEEVRNVTAENIRGDVPKFILLNRMLTRVPLDRYDFVIVCDDDIALPPNFLSDYLALVVKYDFALAQPARTHNSYIDHAFVERLDGLAARRTRFVEIGPLFSVRKDIFPALFPFDESSSMGWGYDFVWPCLIDNLGLHMGIIDAAPVEHRMRRPVRHYVHGEADRSMAAYLARHRHLTHGGAFRILESYVE